MGELVGLFEVLRGEEEGDAVLAVEALDVVPEVLSADGVEAGGGLVQEDDRGLVDERRGEVEAALHAAGIAADPPVGVFGEADDVEQVGDALLDLLPGDVEEAGLQAEQLSSGLEHVEADLLEGDADLVSDAAGVLDDVEAVDGGGAAGGPEQRGEDADGGGLAGAVLAEEAEHLAVGHVEIDAVDGVDVAEVLGQATGLDRRTRGGGFAVSRRFVGRHRPRLYRAPAESGSPSRPEVRSAPPSVSRETLALHVKHPYSSLKG